MKLYKSKEWESCGKFHVQCDELVGTGRNWTEPARILDISVADLLLKLKTEFSADLISYRQEGKLIFVGVSWKTLDKARKWKNYINARAKEVGYMV